MVLINLWILKYLLGGKSVVLQGIKYFDISHPLTNFFMNECLVHEVEKYKYKSCRKVWIIFVLHSMSVCDDGKCNMLR
jgi:hypothetical protein